MKVRFATEKDLDQLTNLRSSFALFEQKYLPQSSIKNNNLLKKETKELLAKKDTKFLVAEEDKILGYLNFFIYSEFKDKIFVGELFVEPAARRKGIANMLFEKLIRWTKDHDRKIIRLNVAKLNKKAIKFFKRMGFDKFESDYLSLEKSLD